MYEIPTEGTEGLICYSKSEFQSIDLNDSTFAMCWSEPSNLTPSIQDSVMCMVTSSMWEYCHVVQSYYLRLDVYTTYVYIITYLVKSRT